MHQKSVAPRLTRNSGEAGYQAGELDECSVGAHRLAVTWRRVAAGPENTNGSVVQLVRTPACHAGGRGFKSHPRRQVERNSA